MRRRGLRPALLLSFLGWLGCGWSDQAEPVAGSPSSRTTETQTLEEPFHAPALPLRSSSEPRIEGAHRPRCVAPSLAYRGTLDDRIAARGCPRMTRPGGKCGATPPTTLDRFAESVPALSKATLDRVRSIAERGRALGRNPRTFGLIGDSITVSTEFMTPFNRVVELDSQAAEALAMPSGGTVIDFYRVGTPNPFQAFRVARIGARVTYPLSDQFDLERLEKEVNPAIVIVTFGANDAAFRTAPPADLADEFGDGLRDLVTRLAEHGMIPIISGEMRHGDSPQLPNCSAPGKPSDWSLAVATNATNARALEVACSMDLPYIDLRHALDGATDQGLGKDGIHLSGLPPRSTVRFTPASLDCGYEVRNYVTLLALKRVLVEADLAK